VRKTKPKALGRIGIEKAPYLLRRDVLAVLKETIQEKLLTVFLRGGPSEINDDRTVTVDLSKGLRVVI
jgi:hypothetical protein